MSNSPSSRLRRLRRTERLRGMVRCNEGLTQVKGDFALRASLSVPSQTKEATMANITRYGPFDGLFDDLARGFWVKPLGVPVAEDAGHNWRELGQGHPVPGVGR